MLRQRVAALAQTQTSVSKSPPSAGQHQLVVLTLCCGARAQTEQRPTRALPALQPAPHGGPWLDPARGTGRGRLGGQGSRAKAPPLATATACHLRTCFPRVLPWQPVQAVFPCGGQQLEVHSIRAEEDARIVLRCLQSKPHECTEPALGHGAPCRSHAQPHCHLQAAIQKGTALVGAFLSWTMSCRPVWGSGLSAKVNYCHAVAARDCMSCIEAPQHSPAQKNTLASTGAVPLA